MNAQTIGDTLAFIAFPAATLFPILYATTAPWYRSMVGWAVITAKVGLALLVDASVLFRLLGPGYTHRYVVVLIAFAVITLGSWLYLIAYIREQYIKRHRRSLS